jgi:lipopolysaccharide transport system ATP-binding protein
MSPVAISATGLSKRYRVPISQGDDSSVTLNPTIGSRRRVLADGRSRWIDAVQDLTFDVEAGEAVGLIGRNGAGKSTLLKLLSRVTRPTSGHAILFGSVGALLEVGTGFHPELTGRENAFLSGAILGMSKRDIRSRFDEIVAFAEIAPFIDMPVKRYSSGMYARLGFAVAAFLKPAILIVDEILAVGDIGFQAKCLAHMRQLSKDGTTVLFVSHNLLGMADFCPRALVIADGRLVFDGPTTSAIGTYRQMLALPRLAEAPLAGRPQHQLLINDQVADDAIECASNDRLRVELRIDKPPDAAVTRIELNLVIETSDGKIAIHLRNDVDGTVLEAGPGTSIFRIEIEDIALVPANYLLWLRVVDLQAAEPVIWDTARLSLVVAGDQRLDSMVRPRHRFAQVAAAGVSSGSESS